jgi:hypothetical protein
MKAEKDLSDQKKAVATYESALEAATKLLTNLGKAAEAAASAIGGGLSDKAARSAVKELEKEKDLKTLAQSLRDAGKKLAASAEKKL